MEHIQGVNDVGAVSRDSLRMVGQQHRDHISQVVRFDFLFDQIDGYRVDIHGKNLSVRSHHLSGFADIATGSAAIIHHDRSFFQIERFQAPIGFAELVNAQFRQPFAAYWGDGTTSSSDGQNFKAGGHGQAAGHVNLKYGQETGMQFYTHISDQ